MVAALPIVAGTLLANELFRPKDTGADALKNAYGIFSGVHAPTADDLRVQLEKMVYQGDITPEQANAYLADPSSLGTADGDPMAKAAQAQALSQLQGISTAGGLTPTDKATLEDVMGRTGSAQRGAREAVMMRAAERGVGDSGTSLVDQMVSDQENAGQANRQGLDVAAQAQQRALAAIQASGQLGGQVEGQAFGEQAQKAAAADAINKFNTTNRNTVEEANVAARNAAIQRNAAEKQRIADTNAQISGEQSSANAAAKQTAFQDQMSKAAGQTGQLKNISDNELENEKNKRAMTGGLISTGGQLLASDEKKKTDIKEVPAKDLEEFMASLDPKTFKYKNPNAPGAHGGDNVGILAQDVETTPVGKTMVKDTPDGKMIDLGKGFGVLMAALASLHDQIEKKGAQKNADA